jgi:hypothetical protein
MPAHRRKAQGAQTNCNVGVQRLVRLMNLSRIGNEAGPFDRILDHLLLSNYRALVFLTGRDDCFVEITSWDVAVR